MAAAGRQPEHQDGGSMPESSSQPRVTIFALVLGSIILYAPLIGWGVPHATAPDRTKTFATDEILPLEGLAEMHNTFVVSKPDRNYGYPWWHYFVVSSAQAPYVGYLLVSGGMEGSQSEYPFGMQDPVAALVWLTLIGRFVSVLMGAGTVAAAYYFSRTLWGHQTGVIAALLTMLNYLMFYYSRTGNLDVPAFFWSSLGLAVLAKIMVAGLTARRAGWLGAFAGLAIATKDQAVVIFLPLICLLLLPRFARSLDLRFRPRPLLIGLAAFVIAYLIGTGMLVDPQRHITHVQALFFEPERVSGASAYWPPHPRTLAGTANLLGDYLQKLVAMSSLPVLLSSIFGAALIWRSTPRLLALLLPVATLFILLILPTGIAPMRYLLPLTLILDAFAAFAVISLNRSRWRLVWVPLLILLCGWRLLIGVDLSYAQYHDTRYSASAWLMESARSGNRLEYFGAPETLPHLSSEIITRPVAGRTQWVGETGHGPALLRYLAEEGPEYVIIIPDWTSRPGMERSADCPPEVYAALIDGNIGYTQAAYFPPRSLLGGVLSRPALDNPSVCPPVRLFARNEKVSRGALD
jgi:4-amino-4-deoxy-L-arabinose transferase-like glycosyltransferase